MASNLRPSQEVDRRVLDKNDKDCIEYRSKLGRDGHPFADECDEPDE